MNHNESTLTDVSEAQAKASALTKLYSPPAVSPPTVNRVSSIAERLGFDLSKSDLEEMTKCIAGLLKPYDRLYRLPEKKPPVKYPRTPGVRPRPEDNPFNAWYVLSTIQGASEGKLKGMRVAVKDCIAVAGVPMMNGSKLLEGYVPDFDATVVTRTLDAGGIILGKSSCEHLCLSGSSFTNDIAPVLNPLDQMRTTGGSSSGSAALVAANLVDLALGGDQAGSVRVPASWCGIVGLKPTYGLIPFTGAAQIEVTVDHLGPMARTVKECAVYLEVLAGPDGMDPRQPPSYITPEYSTKLRSDLTGLRIGVVDEGFNGCEQDVVEVVKQACSRLREAGAEVKDISIPMHADGHAIWSAVDIEGSYETIIRRAGGGPGYKGFLPTSMMDHIHRAISKAPNELSLPLKINSLCGEFLREYNNYHFYCRGANLVLSLTDAYDKALEEVDVIIMPTLPHKAPKLPTEEASISELFAQCLSMMKNTAPFNATGHPSLSINAGLSEGLPVGMMITGKKWAEQDVLDVAYAHEMLASTETWMKSKESC